MDVVECIKNKYVKLSKKQKLIADYLIKNENEISFKTLKEISENVGVTEVTIINFCKTIGLQNFSDLKLKFQELILRKTSPTQKLFQNINKDIIGNDLYTKIIDMHLSNHQATMAKLKETELEVAAELITNSKKTYIICEGLSEIIGLYLQNRLEHLGINVELLNVSNINTSFIMKALKLSKDDLYISITYPKYSKIVIKLSEYIKGKGYNLIGITDKNISPLNQYANITFCSENDSLVFYNSIHSAIGIIEILSSVLSKHCESKLVLMKKDVDEFENEFDTFISK